jgi:hypothetical protein
MKGKKRLGACRTIGVCKLFSPTFHVGSEPLTNYQLPMTIELRTTNCFSPNKPNLNNYKCGLTNETKMTYNNLQKSNIKKTNPIQTQPNPKDKTFLAKYATFRPKSLSFVPQGTNKPNFWNIQMTVTSLLITTNDQFLTTRQKQNKPNSKPIHTQFHPQAHGFCKILTPLPIITRILLCRWPVYPVIQLAEDTELLMVLVNLPVNPADKTNWNHQQARNARKDMSHSAGGSFGKMLKKKNPKKSNS